MTSKAKKTLIGSLLVIGIGAYLISSGMQDSMVYYMTVAEFLENEAKYSKESVKVSGKVVEGTIKKFPEEIRIQFMIEDETVPDKKIEVTYKGQVPDIFKPGINVVVEGNFNSRRIFDAKVLLAKCPSKYQEKVEQPETK